MGFDDLSLGLFRVRIRISTADYVYNTACNLTSNATDSVTATYDAESRIATATKSSVTTAYVYDSDGNRIKKLTPPPPASNPTGTLYWYMTPGIVAESDLSGATKSEYVFFNGERVARRDGVNGAGGVFYYFSDHLKTASVITDAAGTIKAESDYYPWGGEIQFVNADSNHYKFTGKERDTETGLDYFGARYYSNGLGRFITPDWAARAAAVPYAEFVDPQSLNLYTYVRNVPTTRFDADGHCQGPQNGCQAQKETNNFKTRPDDPVEALKGAGKSIVNAVNSTISFLSGGELGGDQLPLSNEDQHVGANAVNQVLAAAPLADELKAGATVAEAAEPASTVSKIESTGAKASKVDEIVKTIDEGGFKVTQNAKTATQEGNVTITHPNEPGVKLNLRTETHPLPDSQGTPVRHVNVERVEPGPKNRPIQASDKHITQ